MSSKKVEIRLVSESCATGKSLFAAALKSIVAEEMDVTINDALKKVPRDEVNDTSVAVWLADVTTQLDQIVGYDAWK
eukprot:6492338-Amphidinium_carterae.5